MADSVNPATLKEAVRGVLYSIPAVGKIETRVGGLHTWLENAQPFQAFWEIQIVASDAELYGAGTMTQEKPVIQIEGWMPFDYARNTQEAFENLWWQMLNVIRQDMTFDGVLTDFPGVPVLQVNETGPYQDFEGARVCHHAILQVTGDFDFDPSS